MFRRLRWFIVAPLLTIAVALAVFIGLGLATAPITMPFLPLSKEVAVVAPGAIIREENSFICGDTELVYQAPASADIIGKGLKGIYAKYPQEQGWNVEIKNDNMVVITKSIDSFCGQHSLYRHLGIYKDRLAIYQGPLGFEQRVMRVEDNKKVENLPSTLREKLYKSKNYKQLPPEEQKNLRSELEFSNEATLNSFLENLDENF